MGSDGRSLSQVLGGWLCRLGWHDFRLVESSFGFGAGSQLQKLRCRRCGVEEMRLR